MTLMMLVSRCERLDKMLSPMVIRDRVLQTRGAVFHRNANSGKVTSGCWTLITSQRFIIRWQAR